MTGTRPLAPRAMVLADTATAPHSVNALHAPDRGVIVCHPSPRARSSGSLWADVLLALGKAPRGPGWPRSRFSALELANTWLRAQRIRHVIVYEADRLARAPLAELEELMDRVGATLWLVFADPARLAGLRDHLHIEIHDCVAPEGQPSLRESSDRSRVGDSCARLHNAGWSNPWTMRAEWLRRLPAATFSHLDGLATATFRKVDTLMRRGGSRSVPKPMESLTFVLACPGNPICPARLTAARVALLHHGVLLRGNGLRSDRFFPLAWAPDPQTSPSISSEIDPGRAALRSLLALGMTPPEIRTLDLSQVARAPSRETHVGPLALGAEAASAVDAQLQRRIGERAGFSDPLFRPARGANGVGDPLFGGPETLGAAVPSRSPALVRAGETLREVECIRVGLDIDAPGYVPALRAANGVARHSRDVHQAIAVHAALTVGSRRRVRLGVLPEGARAEALRLVEEGVLRGDGGEVWASPDLLFSCYLPGPRLHDAPDPLNIARAEARSKLAR